MRFARVFPLCASMLLLGAAAPGRLAHAGALEARVQVSAQVVVSCRLEARVPRVGSPERSTGSASIRATCTKGAQASAHACGDACARPVAARDGLPTERLVAEARADGRTVATLLF